MSLIIYIKVYLYPCAYNAKIGDRSLSLVPGVTDTNAGEQWYTLSLSLFLCELLRKASGACLLRGSHAAFCLQTCCHNTRLRSRTVPLLL